MISEILVAVSDWYERWTKRALSAFRNNDFFSTYKIGSNATHRRELKATGACAQFFVALLSSHPIRDRSEGLLRIIAGRAVHDLRTQSHADELVTEFSRFNARHSTKSMPSLKGMIETTPRGRSKWPWLGATSAFLRATK